MKIVLLLIIVCSGGYPLLVYLYVQRGIREHMVETHQTLEFSNFPKSFGKIQLFFISDIHRRIVSDSLIEDYTKWESGCRYLFGGDLLEKGVPMERVKENIKKLKTLGPTFLYGEIMIMKVDIPILDAMLLHLGVQL